jgi:glycerophosphoryl diester phosphodiesterase
MIDNPWQVLRESFQRAWEFRWPLLLSRLVFSLLMLAVMAPLGALAVRAAVALSGQPALSDFDIVMYLLSPAGFVAGLLAASLLLAIAVLDISFMLAITQDAGPAGWSRVEGALIRILPRMAKLFGFAWRILLRLLAIVAPFIAIALLIAKLWLTEYDINYYLAERPPEFLRALAVGGVLLAAVSMVLAYKLVGWSAALPLLLFSDATPKQSFMRSEAAVRGQRWQLLTTFCLWALISALLTSVTTIAAHGAAASLAGSFETDLRQLALLFVSVLAVWSVLNLLVATVTLGALAGVLMSAAGWPTSPRDTAVESPWLRKALLGGLLVAGVSSLAGLVDVTRYRTDDEVQIIAHRGASAERPENTLAAIALAIAQQAHWVEVDVQESADGEVIVMHDSDFMKIGGTPAKTWELTVEDLEKIDIGSWFSDEYASERTPLLRDVLELARDSGTGVLIELKYYGHDEALERRVADIVQAMGMAGQVRFMSLKYSGVQTMKSVQPAATVGLLASTLVGNLPALDVDFLAVNTAAATANLVRDARAVGKFVYVWTVNDPLTMSHMASLGVAGLITDQPALARVVLAQRADLSAIERLVLALGSRLGLSTDDNGTNDQSP